MANLIEGRMRACEFEALDAARLGRLRNRLIAIRALARGALERPAESAGFDRRAMADAFADDLEEFELAISEPTLDALLGEIDARRRAAVSVVGGEVAVDADTRGPIAPGCAFGIHLFGRSLATGEAEIASRGFFDEHDRPPLEFWIETVRQPSLRRDEGAGVGVLFCVPEVLAARARAGCGACPSGALTLIDASHPAIYAQLAPLLEGDA